MKRLVIFGIGQIAEVAHYMFSEDSDYEVVGFTVDKRFRVLDRLFKLPVVAFEEIETIFPPNNFSLFIAMGYSNLNELREQKTIEAQSKGYKLASYVSTRAWVWREFKLKSNVMIMEHNTIQPYTEVGANTILWSGNHVGHHTKIGDNVFISSHAVIAGSVTIGDNCFIGINATVRDNISIGNHCVIGAGALITKDTLDRSVLPGSATKPSKIPSNRLRTI